MIGFSLEDGPVADVMEQLAGQRFERRGETMDESGQNGTAARPQDVNPVLMPVPGHNCRAEAAGRIQAGAGKISIQPHNNAYHSHERQWCPSHEGPPAQHREYGCGQGEGCSRLCNDGQERGGGLARLIERFVHHLPESAKYRLRYPRAE